MAIKILHTADVHLGMRFTRGYPSDVQQALVNARFEALERLVDLANEEKCQLFVVAGDLFDRQNIAKKDLLRSAEILKKFEGPALLILPGNHDFIGGSDSPMWNTLADNLADTAVILREPRVYDLREYGLATHIYPAPCTAKHSPRNAIGWIREAEIDPAVPHHIGIAHGSLQGLSPDFEDQYYPMTPEELQQAPVNLWLLGHTHVRYPMEERGSGHRIFFPSTPEPDGFDCQHTGHAWLIDLTDQGEIRYQSLATGKYRFKTARISLSDGSSLQEIRKIAVGPDAKVTLLKLQLSGRIPGELFEALGSLLPELEKQLFYLETDTAGLLRQINREDIDREFVEGSFPHRLLSSLSGDDELALQMAYELIREVKE